VRIATFLLLLAIAAGAEDALSIIRAWVPDEKELRIKDEILREHPERGPLFPKKDPWINPFVRDALADPLWVPGGMRSYGGRILAGSGAHFVLDVEDDRKFPGRAEPLMPAGLPELDKSAREGVAVLYGACAHATAEVEKAYASLTEEEYRFVRETMPKWLTRTTEADRERARKGAEDVEARDALLRCAALMEKVDFTRLRRLLVTVEFALREAVPLLRKQGALKPGRTVIKTPLGPIVLRGSNNGGGDEDALLVIDFGGDDEYRTPMKPKWRPVRIHLDLSGDDLYLARAPFAWGSALGGVSVLVDVEGDDDYRGRDWSLGCALGGVALLHDRGGNDRYMGGLGTQAVGIFGDGILIDDAGDDEYHAGVFAQGFASTGGRGTLVDRSGHDLYVAGRDEEDSWRRPGTWITFAQGSSFSHRFGHILEEEGKPRRWKMTGQLAGGLGELYDGGGNDRYVADVFGQGAAYWYGLAVLVDLGGDDSYRATWYGQGVGTHAAVGCLVDVAGNDRYHSRNTSQGCGHDFSAGILVDHAGDDHYRSMALSQGAGNAKSGIGVLIDERGNDSYRCESGAWGFMRPEKDKPEASPYGFFLDLGGTNRYAGRFAEKRGRGEWKNGTRGFGLDRNEKKSK
jgi:hypothetical protein